MVNTDRAIVYLDIQRQISDITNALDCVVYDKDIYDPNKTVDPKDIDEVRKANMASDTNLYLIDEDVWLKLKELTKLYDDTYGTINKKDKEVSTEVKKEHKKYPFKKLFKLINPEQCAIHYKIHLVHKAQFVTDPEKMEHYIEEQYSVWCNTENKRTEETIEHFRNEAMLKKYDADYIHKREEEIRTELANEMLKAKEYYELIKADKGKKFEVVLLGYHNAFPYLSLDARYKDQSYKQNIHLYKDGVPNFLYFDMEVWLNKSNWKEGFMQTAQRAYGNIWFREKE
ncbi:MAG: hypothetical protein COB67_02445 [SAR324 cluster bacterium]|uniref:Uncharacterized protein n=1 Tax=SAR324 cluster bacterium TaxID=2024889 RepID=A0A2A4T9W9_9DELT|nr:MAG: hypothetical protein COB67_02445 [SAR324 cluster bacterium]